MRHRTKSRGRIGRERRQKIDKARRVVGTGDFTLGIVLMRVVGFIGRGVLAYRPLCGLPSGLLFDLRRRSGVERNALLDRAVRIEFSPVGDLKTDLFLVLVFADHNFLVSLILASRRKDFPDCQHFRDLLDYSGMSKAFDGLVAVMARLRAPGGCPWDH